MTIQKLWEIIHAIRDIDGSAEVSFVSESYVLDDDIKKIKETNYATNETSRVENVSIDFRKSGNRITIKTT